MNYECSIQNMGRMKKDIFSSDPATAAFATGSGCRQESKRNNRELATGYAGLRPLRNHGSVAFSCPLSYCYPQILVKTRF